MAHIPYLAYTDDPTLVVGHATHAGRSGKNNEDLYAVFDTRFDADATGFASQRVLVVAVADGIGGSVAGEMASDLAVQAIATGFRDTHKPPPVRLDTAIRRANGDIYRNSVDNPALAGMGTTIVAAAIGADQIQVGHAGDSRAYLLRAGKLSLLTQDHSWAQEALEAGRLTADEAKIHPNRHVIKRFLGGAPDLEVDYRIVDPASSTNQGAGLHSYRDRVELLAGDTLLFCTDGLTDVVSDATIASILTKGAPQQAADKLINEANRAGGPDNITVVVVRKAGGPLLMAAGKKRPQAIAVLLLLLLAVLAGAGVLLLRNFSGESTAKTSATPAGIMAATQDDTKSEATAPAASATALDPTAAQPAAQPAAEQGAESSALEAVSAAPKGTAGTLTPAYTFAATPQSATVEVDALVTATADASRGASEGVTSSVETKVAPAVVVDSNAEIAPLVAAEVTTESTLPPTRVAASLASAAADTRTPAAALRPATSTPVMPTPTMLPTATPTPQPTATNLPTTTPAPRSTAAPAASGTGTPIAVPTASAAPTTNAADESGVIVAASTSRGPTSVTITGPDNGLSFSENSRVTFSWSADMALEDGQGFEVVSWQVNEEPIRGYSAGSASTASSIDVKPNWTGPRKWGVLLVTLNPYTRIRYLGDGREITVSEPAVKEPGKPSAPDPSGQIKP